MGSLDLIFHAEQCRARRNGVRDSRLIRRFEASYSLLPRIHDKNDMLCSRAFVSDRGLKKKTAAKSEFNRKLHPRPCSINFYDEL